MKICFLMYQGNMYSGGQGVYLYYLTRELARMGHDVHVIAGPPYPHARRARHGAQHHDYSYWTLPPLQEGLRLRPAARSATSTR